MDYQQPPQEGGPGQPQQPAYDPNQAPQQAYPQPQQPAYDPAQYPQQPYQAPQQQTYDPGQYQQQAYQQPQQSGYNQSPYPQPGYNPGPYQPPYQQPGFPRPAGPMNIMALIGLICGGLSALFALIHFFYNPVFVWSAIGGFGQWFSVLPILFGAGGIVTSVLGNKEVPAKGGKAFALAGLICACVGAGFGLLQFFVCGVCTCATMSSVSSGWGSLSSFF